MRKVERPTVGDSVDGVTAGLRQTCLMIEVCGWFARLRLDLRESCGALVPLRHDPDQDASKHCVVKAEIYTQSRDIQLGRESTKACSGLEGNKMGRSEGHGLSNFRLTERAARSFFSSLTHKGPCCCCRENCS
jgi:hypothetical protein